MVEQRPFKALVVGSSPTQPKSLTSQGNRLNKGFTNALVLKNLNSIVMAKVDKIEAFGKKSGTRVEQGIHCNGEGQMVRDQEALEADYTGSVHGRWQEAVQTFPDQAGRRFRNSPDLAPCRFLKTAGYRS